MYRYTEFDHDFLKTRNAQFRAQVERRLSGALTEDEFKPLRLMNGLYLQLHAYMLRVAIPYGTLSAVQMRKLADVADRWDKGYGHFTTRQNIQFKLAAPARRARYAGCAGHGRAARDPDLWQLRCATLTADHFAGAAADEIADPRPVAELLRQWSTGPPGVSVSCRASSRLAITGSPRDRAANACA